jgi:hypothetical protein
MPRGIGGCRDSRVRHRRVYRCRHLSHLSFSFQCTVHQINDSRRLGRATTSQMSAAAIASDPIATAPSITFTVVTLGKTI